MIPWKARTPKASIFDRIRTAIGFWILPRSYRRQFAVLGQAREILDAAYELEQKVERQSQGLTLVKANKEKTR